jgi:hypothetical protein
VQAVCPNARISCVKIVVVNLDHGIVVPQLHVRKTDANLWDEVAILTQASVVEVFYMCDWNVQAAYIA